MAGPCTTGGSCVKSPNFPLDYGANQDCDIEILQTGVLSATSFSTESGYDKLTLGAIDYSGTNGPMAVSVSAGDHATWRSDYSIQSTGWKVCLGECMPA